MELYHAGGYTVSELEECCRAAARAGGRIPAAAPASGSRWTMNKLLVAVNPRLTYLPRLPLNGGMEFRTPLRNAMTEASKLVIEPTRSPPIRPHPAEQPPLPLV